MGNRCFLYVVRPLEDVDPDHDDDEMDDDDGGVEEIADANNLLPSLWQILLADARPAAAIEYQRVFGDAGTNNVASAGTAALERFSRFSRWLRGHPRFREVPALALYLDAAQAHLGQLLEAEEPGEAAPLLSANLDELSWLEDTTPERFISDTLAQFRSTWASLESLINAGEYEGLDALLGFTEWHVGITEWKAWSTVFGLASFSHPYFFGTWDEPRTIAFEDYSEDDDEQSGNTYLGAGCERFRDGELWGVRRAAREDRAGHIVTSAQWQKIKPATDSESRSELPDDAHRCWVMRDGRYALMALAGTRAGALLTGHEFNDAWAFDANGIAIVQQDDRMGFVRPDGSWHLPPVWNEVWRFEHGLATVGRSGLQGYIDFEGRIVFEPQFDDALPFNADGTTVAARAGQWSLLHRDGRVVVSGCRVINGSEEFNGWFVERDGHTGLFHLDGAPWLPIEFDAIHFTAARQPIVVVREGRSGLHDWRGESLLPCEYVALRPIATAHEDLERSAGFGAGLFVATDARQRLGLIDAAGHVLIPFEFAAIDLFPSQRGPRNKVENARQIRVGMTSDADGGIAYGIWDLEQQRCILPCEYRHVWLIMLGAGDSFGFLVATAADRDAARTLGKYAVSLLRSDLQPMFPQVFAWVGRKIDLDRYDAMAQIREALYLPWATGRTVPASRGKKGPEIQLKRDGSWVSK